jgi:hypothetical protein
LDNPPEIFAVDELRALLMAAKQQAPDVLPMLAIGAFAGLMPENVFTDETQSPEFQVRSEN